MFKVEEWKVVNDDNFKVILSYVMNNILGLNKRKI